MSPQLTQPNVVALHDKFGIKYEALNITKKETLNQWVQAKQELALSDVKDYIPRLIEAVERDLTTHDLPKNKDPFLKAR
jgi:hypothetical protein